MDTDMVMAIPGDFRIIIITIDPGAETLKLNLTGGAAVRDTPTDDLDAYDCVLRATPYFDLSRHDRDLHLDLRECAERAVETDPNYAMAWTVLAYMYMDESRNGFNPRPGSLERALEAARRAVQLDGDNAIARQVLALIYFHLHDLDAFGAESERAIALNPNNASVLADLGGYLVSMGEVDRGLPMVKKAMDVAAPSAACRSRTQTNSSRFPTETRVDLLACAARSHDQTPRRIELRHWTR